MDSTYKYGSQPGTGVNRESLGGKRKRPSKRLADRVEFPILRDTSKVERPSPDELKRMKQRELQRKRNTV